MIRREAAIGVKAGLPARRRGALAEQPPNTPRGLASVGIGVIGVRHDSVLL